MTSANVTLNFNEVYGHVDYVFFQQSPASGAPDLELATTRGFLISHNKRAVSRTRIRVAAEQERGDRRSYDLLRCANIN
jgi:hypothetical protein